MADAAGCTSPCASLSKADMLRGVVAEKLSTAAQEIVAVVERTLAGYEEEAWGLRQEVERQRRLLEVLLQLKLEAIDDQFPVSEPAAAGGAPPPEEARQPGPEPGVAAGGDVGGPVSSLEVQPRDHEEEEDHEGLTEPDPLRLSAPVRSDRPGHNKSQDPIDLKIRVFDNSTIKVVTVKMLQYPVLELRCPRGLQEVDFLDLLRSSSPLLTAQTPFEILVMGRNRKLKPLVTKTLTPEEIQKTHRNKILYLRVTNTSEDDAAVLQTEDQPTSSDRTESLSQEPQNYIDLKVRILGSHESAILSNKVFRSHPEYIVSFPRGLQEADFLDLLKATFPQLAAWTGFDFFVTNKSRKLLPLRVNPLRTLDICCKNKPKTLYIRPKPPGDVQTGETNCTKTKSSSVLLLPLRVWSRKKRSIKLKEGPLDSVSLRICILEESKISVMNNNAYKKYPVLEVQCPRGLQQADFLDLLRNMFPQLEVQKPLEFLMTDKTKKLQPLNVTVLTPEEISRSLSAAGRSALYIRPKVAHADTRGVTMATGHPPTVATSVTKPRVETDVFQGREDAFHVTNNSKESSFAGDQTGLNTSSQHADEDEDEDARALLPAGRLSSPRFRSGGRADENVKPGRRVAGETRNRRRSRRLRGGEGAALWCKVCRLERRSNAMLVRHAWIHVDDHAALCGVCGERPASAQELRTHLQNHQRAHSCELCGRCFVSAGGLNRHRVTHRDRKPFKCDVCNKTFVYRVRLAKHTCFHMSGKAHKCVVCHKSFVSRLQLAHHSQTHAADRKSLRQQFRCTTCSKTFDTRLKLRVHTRVHSRAESETPTNCSVRPGPSPNTV